MLYDLVKHDDVRKCRLRKRTALRRGFADIRHVERCLSDLFSINVHAVHISAEPSKFFDVHADAAAHVKDPSTHRELRTTNKIETTILASSPDVARVPEADGLFGCDRHASPSFGMLGFEPRGMPDSRPVEDWAMVADDLAIFKAVLITMSQYSYL